MSEQADRAIGYTAPIFLRLQGEGSFCLSGRHEGSEVMGFGIFNSEDVQQLSNAVKTVYLNQKG